MSRPSSTTARATTPANSSCRLSEGSGAIKRLIISMLYLLRVLRDALKQYNTISQRPSAGKENKMQKLVIETTDANLLKPIIEGVIQRELEDIERGIELTRAHLGAFEKQYKMTTVEFLRRFTRDDLGETLDFIEWDGEVKTLELLEEKKALFEEAKVD